MKPGDVDRGVLGRGKTVIYPLQLRASEAVLIEVDQSAVDVKIEFRTQGGELLLSWDTPTHRGAPERLCVVAEVNGPHNVALAPFEGAGAYEIRLLRRRNARPDDRLCFRAARFFQSAQNREPKSALSEFENAAQLWERAGEPFLAGLAWREAASRWRDVGPAGNAVNRLELALAAARASANSYLEISILNRLGLALIDIGELAGARVRLDAAYNRSLEADDTWGQASALTNLGLLDDFLGQPHHAIDRFSQALALWRERGDSIETAQVLQNMAVAYGVLDYHDRALDLLSEALRLTRDAGDEDREAKVLFSQGWIHYLRGRPEDGLTTLQRVLTIWRRRGDRNGEAVVLDRLGTLLREDGRFVEAEQAYQSSLAISIETQSTFDAIATTANLGCLYVETGQLEAAQLTLRDALRQYSAFDDPRAVSHVEYCLARAKGAVGDTKAALQHIRRALDIVDQLRRVARTSGHYYRPIWLWQEYAEFEIELLFRRFQESRDSTVLARAFEAADAARARTLLEQVVETRLGVDGLTEESLLATERDLQEKLDQRAHQRMVSAESTTAGQLDSEIRRLQGELERVRARIRVAARQPAERLLRPVTVELAQQLLDEESAFLSYTVGEEKSHLIVISRSQSTVHELPPRRDLEPHARALHVALRGSRTDNVQWRLIAAKLGPLLIPQKALSAEIRRLFIIPDGLLHYVPFTVLASAPSEQRLVIEDFEVTYIPSVSLLARLRERRRDRVGNRIAVFADPVFARDDDRLQDLGRILVPSTAADSGAGRLRALPELGRLHHSAAEALAIARFGGSQRTWLNLGFDATRRRVLTADLRPYGIVHFATHARIDDSFPELSGLFLSRFNAAGRPIGSELRLHAIHGLELNTELTVLSSCDTALGEHVRGNGVEGFAHGFLSAGSSRVLVSLWKVDDKATALLMAEFYRNLLKGGEAPLTALRNAQRSLRRQARWQAPYYWAPFVLQGAD